MILCLIKYFLAFMWGLMGVGAAIALIALTALIEIANAVGGTLGWTFRWLWDAIADGEFTPWWNGLFFEPGDLLDAWETFFPWWFGWVGRWALANGDLGGGDVKERCR